MSNGQSEYTFIFNELLMYLNIGRSKYRILLQPRVLFFLLVISSCPQLRGQVDSGDKNNEALAIANEAITLMDQGNYEKSISLLRDCIELDPEHYVYSYEIGLAYVYQNNYSDAIKELKKTLKYEQINSQVYQLLGNAYSMSGNPKKAIKTYDKGLENFKDAANLYLEKGNVYLQKSEFDDAVYNYENGIKVDPMYPTTYYRLAQLFLNSKNKIPGFIYGEIFMNIERTTERTREMSELLYTTYDKSISISGDSISIDLCPRNMVMSVTDLLDVENLKLPYCLIFGKHFSTSLPFNSSFDINFLDHTRQNFINSYYEVDYNDYPVVLFDYHRKMIDAGIFEAYNYYLFQISRPEEFADWKSKNNDQFDRFIEWYTTEENMILLDQENKYLRQK